LRVENWKAPASPRLADPTSQGRAANQPSASTVWWTPPSKMSATHPNISHTAR
jgi:hypothetical protein